MQQTTTVFVGLDVHKDSISVAYAVACPTPAQQIVFQESVLAVDEQVVDVSRQRSERIYS